MESEELQELEERQLKLLAFAEGLLRKRDEAIKHRIASGVERRWKEDEAIKDGLDSPSERASMIQYATGDASIRDRSSASRSRVVVNIIRGRCEIARGRFSDIMLPTDGRNWGMDITPVPELVELEEDTRPAMQEGQQIIHDTGEPATMRDVALDIREKARKKMAKMEAEIDDQLTECNYNGECRKVIDDAIHLGTGVIKGPIVKSDIKRSWNAQKDETGEAWVVKAELRETPTSKRVSPWAVYPSPDCKENPQKASYIWERDTIRPREVRELLKLEEYFADQLKLVLDEEPRRTTPSLNEKQNNWEVNQDTVEKGHAYELWEYHGDVDKEDLINLGCDCEDSEFASLSACVVFINDRPVKATLNVLDTAALPYDFFQWTTVSDSPWGIGIPRQAYWLQRIITNAWRAMLDNAGDSKGANVAIGDGVEPVDGRMEITGKKLWRVTGVDVDVRKAFGQFQIQNNQEPLQRIIELALKFVDFETSIPAIFQGEAQEIPETLGATNIVVDSANVGLRQRVKLFDDRITEPHLTRYYDWNMQYNPNNDIKGDYRVDALGVSVLYERDQQAQALLQAFQLKGDRDVEAEVDWRAAVREFFKSRKLEAILKDPADVDAEKKKEQPKPLEMQLAEMKIQGELKKEQMRQEDAERERNHEKAIKQLEAEIAMVKLATEKDISIDSIKASLASDTMKLKMQEKLALTTKATQVTTPPTEPPGRAPNGQAYQR